MKRNKTSALLILSCILVVISFSACSNDLDLPIKAPQAPSSIYPLKDVHVTASGLVSTKLNKNANLHAARGFKAEDFVITPISEEEAKEVTSAFEKYCDDHQDEIEALRMIYNNEGEPLTYYILKDLRTS